MSANYSFMFVTFLDDSNPAGGGIYPYRQLRDATLILSEEIVPMPPGTGAKCWYTPEQQIHHIDLFAPGDEQGLHALAYLPARIISEVLVGHVRIEMGQLTYGD